MCVCVCVSCVWPLFVPEFKSIFIPSFLSASLIPVVVGVIMAESDGHPHTPADVNNTVNWLAHR